MKQLSYSIAIATRNRLDALKISLPRMIEQTRAPQKIVISDSSDDHGTVAKEITNIFSGYNLKPTIIKSPRGSSIQRNIAVEEIDSPVTFFPDDDSIWKHDFAEKIMEAYEHNPDASAVCGQEVAPHEIGLPSERGIGYKKKNSEKILQKTAYFRKKIEGFLFPADPFEIIGAKHLKKYKPTTWNERKNIVPVKWMTGFRMSFKTEAIKRSPFLEALGDYALNEDIEASFSAWKQGAVLAAKSAKVYHHKFPSRRTNGYKMGVITILNRSYVSTLHSEGDQNILKAITKHAKFTVRKYKLASSKSSYLHERYLGARDAYDLVHSIISAPTNKATQIYTRCIEELNPNF